MFSPDEQAEQAPASAQEGIELSVRAVAGGTRTGRRIRGSHNRELSEIVRFPAPR